MTDFLKSLFTLALLVWAFSNLAENRASIVFVFVSFFSASMSSVFVLRLTARVAEWIKFESVRDKKSIVSNRARLS